MSQMLEPDAQRSLVLLETGEGGDAAAIGASLANAIRHATAALIDRQKPDGHWVFELEADATIPADFVLLQHILDRIDERLQARIGRYLRRIQTAHGGWSMYPGGGFDLSVSVRAYCALKAIGDCPEAPHMRRARDAILAAGGAERANTFARIQLALLGAIPWHGIPAMPVEILLLPDRFVFSLWRVAYWSRTFIVPLVVLQALRPAARNPSGFGLGEIFRQPPEQIADWCPGPGRSPWARLFKGLDAVLKRIEPHAPRRLRMRAIARALAFVEPRLNGTDGIGAIYPPIAYTLMMFDALGISADDPRVAATSAALDGLIVERVETDEAYIQPCVSPVWDSGWCAWACAAAAGAGMAAAGPALARACDWLALREIRDLRGDWSVLRPDAPAGGWAFQYRNDHYPDVDDTALVALLLHRHGGPIHHAAIARARAWILGMQSRNGGWGAFDADNDRDLLNHIPFADHGALLDPPTADVTARCITFLAGLGHAEDRAAITRAIDFLRADQAPDGSWFGRWGMNYVYGTWSVLVALRAAGLPPHDPAVRRAADWLEAIQRTDGGWGEDAQSYADNAYVALGQGLPSQTAWAMLGLIAAGRSEASAVARGADWLLRHQQPDGTWREDSYNAVGFPRVLYLLYHGYRIYFPLMALSAWRIGQERRGEDASLPPLDQVTGQAGSLR